MPEQLSLELNMAEENSVGVLVGDHGITADMAQVLQVFTLPVMPFGPISDLESAGCDANIAQRVNRARGKYVLYDLLLHGKLAPLCSYPESGEHGIVWLRRYGYDRAFSCEYPGGSAVCKFVNAGSFLVATRPCLTLILSCAINKKSARERRSARLLWRKSGLGLPRHIGTSPLEKICSPTTTGLLASARFLAVTIFLKFRNFTTFSTIVALLKLPGMK
jgi:hypothetical protein